MKLLQTRQRRGNYSMIMGVTIFTIMGFAALAVDISLITMAELQAQATADAASHAALVAYRTSDDPNPQNDGNAAANLVIDRNIVGMGHADLDAIRYGSYVVNPGNGLGVFNEGTTQVNAVEVAISRKDANAVPLVLAPMFGVNEHDVEAEALTAHQPRAIMLVQDWSCSMNGGAMDLSRAANRLFLDYLVTFNQAGDLLGLTGYAGLGAMPASATLGGGGALLATDPPWMNLELVKDNWDGYLKTSLAGLCDTNAACPNDPPTTAATLHPMESEIGSCTNPAIAMLQALDEMAFSNKTNLTYFRGFVVMSDGDWNCHHAGLDPVQATYDVADDAYNNFDIHIWTILYSNGFSIQPGQMDMLKRGLGFFQNSPTAADLPDTYRTVAESLPTAIVKPPGGP